jgi:hypothetical protein
MPPHFKQTAMTQTICHEPEFTFSIAIELRDTLTTRRWITVFTAISCRIASYAGLLVCGLTGVASGTRELFAAQRE